MRRPSYLGEDSGSQAITGQPPRIVKQSWTNPIIVSQTVSHWLFQRPNSLLHTQLKLEARVGIEPTNAAFAEPCLTTWLPRRKGERKINYFDLEASSTFEAEPGLDEIKAGWNLSVLEIFRCFEEWHRRGGSSVGVLALMVALNGSRGGVATALGQTSRSRLRETNGYALIWPRMARLL